MLRDHCFQQNQAHIIITGLANSVQNELTDFLINDKGFAPKSRLLYKNLVIHQCPIILKTNRRSLWIPQNHPDAILFVIDTSQLDNFADAELELKKLVNNIQYKYTHFIVLLNIIDDESAHVNNLNNVRTTLKNLNSRIRMFEINCKTGRNIVETFDWLNKKL